MRECSVWKTVSNVDGCMKGEWPKPFSHIGINEHRTDHVPIGKIMAFSNAVLLWCMWYSSFELDSHFIGIVSESPFNEFGGIIATYRSYFCVMNIFRMFLKYFEEFESFVPRM